MIFAVFIGVLVLCVITGVSVVVALVFGALAAPFRGLYISAPG